jgi:hypothetical protein
MLDNADEFVNFMLQNITDLCIIRPELIEFLFVNIMEVNDERL